MNRALGTALVVLLLSAAALSGCGGEAASTATNTATVPAVEKPSAAAAQDPTPESAEPDPPKPHQKHTAPAAEVPSPPSPDSSAYETGQKACLGMTALEAAKRFEMPARHAGASKQFAAVVADPTPSVKSSPGYPRLVAALYATTLPAGQRADAAAGCAAELASHGSGG